MQCLANRLELVYSRLSESAIKELIRKNVTGFTENKIKVEMSSGPCYQPIVLTVHEFVPSNPEFLSLSYVEKDCVGELQKFTPSYAPPLGLHGIGINDLRNKCLSHIESIIEKGRDLGELISGDTSIISWKVLEAITCYHKLSGGFTANVSTLYERLRGRQTITDLEGSASKNCNALRNALLHEPPYYPHKGVSRGSCCESSSP